MQLCCHGHPAQTTGSSIEFWLKSSPCLDSHQRSPRVIATDDLYKCRPGTRFPRAFVLQPYWQNTRTHGADALHERLQQVIRARFTTMRSNTD